MQIQIGLKLLLVAWNTISLVLEYQVFYISVKYALNFEINFENKFSRKIFPKKKTGLSFCVFLENRFDLIDLSYFCLKKSQVSIY